MLHTFTNSGSYTGISKGCATTLYTVSASLTSFIGEHPRRPHGDRSHWGFRPNDHDGSKHHSVFQHRGPHMWDTPLDESRAAGSNPLRLRRPSISPVRSLCARNGYLRSEPHSPVLEPSCSRIPRCLVAFRRSITCGLSQFYTQYSRGRVRASLRMLHLLVSPTRCGGCCSRVGVSRPQRDLLLGRCTTTFAKPPLPGSHLRRRTPLRGQSYCPQFRFVSGFGGIPLVPCVG